MMSGMAEFVVEFILSVDRNQEIMFHILNHLFSTCDVIVPYRGNLLPSINANSP